MSPDHDQPAWAVRLERKLDALLEALAEEIEDEDGEEESSPALDLAGRPIRGLDS